MAYHAETSVSTAVKLVLYNDKAGYILPFESTCKRNSYF